MRFSPLMILLLPLSAEAQVRMVGLEGEAGITFEATSLISDLEPFGYAPIVLEVKNDTDRDRRWTVHTRATRGWGSRDIAISERTIEVPRSSARTFEILAPLPGVTERAGHVDLTFTVEGYGVRNKSAYLAGQLPTYYGTPRPFVALSTALEAKDRDRFLGTSSPILAVKIDPARMPADWRGLIGLDAIWLLPADTAAMSDDAHRALLDWVLHGGHLFICTGGSSVLPPYGLRLRPEELGPYGYGQIATLDWDGVGITEAVTQVATQIPIRDRSERERGEFHARIKHVSVNRALMLAFLLLFGLIVGPFNLFWLARRERRARLLWSTPLISVVASALLMAMILLQDGVGGAGHRFAVSLLMPDRASEVFIQEQISRTGVLLSTTFSEIDGSFLAPLQIEEGSYGSRSYAISRGRHSGDWFTTRSVQAQRLELVRGSRSRVELIGSDDGRPKIASSLPVAVDLFYADDNGAMWWRSDVRPGDRVTLEPAQGVDVSKFFMEKLSHATPLLRGMVERQRSRSKFFFAAGRAELALDTLPSITWSDDDALFLGPVREVAP